MLLSPQYPVAGSANNAFTGLLPPNLLLKQRYRILGQVGKGGFSAVYKVEDSQFGNRLLAVKEMSQSGLSPQEIIEAADAFKQEALLLAGLQHPHLPRVYDHFSEAGRWYFVMDFIEGETLEEYLNNAKGKRLPIEQVLQIGIDLCGVVGYLHTRQPTIIFRDLKPANIILTPEGHLYLIDFGIARHFKPGQSKDTIAFGSPGYAAPEQYGNTQSTPRADIYSLGATLHQLLTGNDPSGSPFQFAPLQLQGQPPPPGLEPLIIQMLDMNVSKRPASMVAVQQELQRFVAQLARGQVTSPQPSVSLQATSPSYSPQSLAQTTASGASQKTAQQWLKIGDDLSEAKHYQEALAAYEQAIQLDPNDAAAYNGKGSVLSNLKRNREAILAYTRAIQLDPNSADAYHSKGNALFALNGYQKAITAYERAIQLDPTFAIAYFNKGRALELLGRASEAQQAFNRALLLGFRQ